ncbi:MAG TPA: TauD/TfdA family dioxygenase [Acetobacteraceae bacterium]|nr:TauD/TfdA family dioxygenase [Acetobacteraceae bacterium]
MDGIRNTRFRHIEANRIAGALGAEIAGVDLARDIGDEVMDEIRAALHENLVIFFRDQALTPERQLAFARRWGEIHLHPFVEGLPEHPEILEIRKAETDKRNFGGTWHSDQMFAPQPALGTMLYARRVPEAGGDTMFTNQYLAYETLSDGMRRMLDPLRAVSVGEGGKKYGGKSRREFYADRLTTVKVRDTGDLQTTSAHPLVRTHPETGRKSLYIGSHVQYFAGMTEEESQPLLDFLTRHSTRPEFTCRFVWRTGSLAFWDNRCTQHFAINDYPAGTRLMHRITIRGDTPV